jgi:2-isopropylmalate synthase
MFKAERERSPARPDRVPGAPGMRADAYQPHPPVPLSDRGWPDCSLEAPPRWCSVDLRDGNQALAQPMGPAQKRRFFDALVAVGFREIEVGFPAASASEYAFIRELIESRAIPEEVCIQVLTQAREDLIVPTMEALDGADQAIVHLYNSTSTLQRRVVFERDRAGVMEIARRGAGMIREVAARMPETRITLEYSPESFTGTELDFALEICEAVADEWGPTADDPIIVNLPATVEMGTPNLYADQIEYFARHVRGREKMILSVHPHNDRGTAVAAAELALMAGAQRLEGTLFGNGERTGNVDLVTVALNLFTQGIDPALDLEGIDDLVALYQECTGMSVHPRHPYAGELVFTAFSGSHQDAIRKGLAALEEGPGRRWEVPYLPVDPAHVGRGYDALVRVNSQSGKGGVAFVLENDHGYSIPRAMQVEFQRKIQESAEATGGEVGSAGIRSLFESEYLAWQEPLACRAEACRFEKGPGGEWRVAGEVFYQGDAHAVEGEGNGPIDALFTGLCGRFGLSLTLSDYWEHAAAPGSDAEAVAYVEVAEAGGRRFFGAGRGPSSVGAALEAVVSALNRALA